MINLKNFELHNSELIFGGDLIPTRHGGGKPEKTFDEIRDVYDTGHDRIVYF